MKTKDREQQEGTELGDRGDNGDKSQGGRANVATVADVAGVRGTDTGSKKAPPSEQLATAATMATHPRISSDVATLIAMCADLGVSPTAARARVSVAELEQLVIGAAPDTVLMRFGKAVGKVRAKGIA